LLNWCFSGHFFFLSLSRRFFLRDFFNFDLFFLFRFLLLFCLFFLYRFLDYFFLIFRFDWTFLLWDWVFLRNCLLNLLFLLLLFDSILHLLLLSGGLNLLLILLSKLLFRGLIVSEFVFLPFSSFFLLSLPLLLFPFGVELHGPFDYFID
jgi:hypothetical protein